MSELFEHQYGHYEQAVERRRLLDGFAKNPYDNAIWERAYGMVRQEGDSVEPETEQTTAADIAAETLIAFADEIRATPQGERYALTARRAPNGRDWFDVLHTFSMEQAEHVKLAALYSLQEQGFEFGAALDLGTGTGKSLATLEAVADAVVGVDRNPALLELAQERKADNTQLIRADATELPFEDKSFNLVSSRGLEGALSIADNRRMLNEIARVLKPGGVYVTASVIPDKDGYKGWEMDAICWSSKAMLADMIVDSTSGGLDVEHGVTAEQYDELLKDSGLEAYGMRVYDDDDGGVEVGVTILKKPGAY